MAKKKAVKKAVKKVAAKKKKTGVAGDVEAQEAAVHKVIDELTDNEVEEVMDPAANHEQAVLHADAGSKGKNKEGVADRMFDKVKLNVPIHMKYNGKKIPPGVHIFARHEAVHILSMIQKKRKSDLSMFTGKNYMLERLLDRSLRIKEVNNLDVREMAR